MSRLINVAIVGCTGYTGLELIKILSKHKKVRIKNLYSRNNYGKYIYEIYPEILIDLPKIKNYENINISNLDVVFLSLPQGVSQEYIKNIINKTKIIDLSADFRLQNPNEYKKWYNKTHKMKKKIIEFTYGLSEINKKKISNSNNISVPGCYPTSILLPLIPLVKNKLIKKDHIIIDSKSGYSGAGRGYDLSKLIRNNLYNSYNYNSNIHRHIPEIEQELSKYTKNKININFNPHILPIERGIISSIYCILEKKITTTKITKFLKNYYKKDKFILIEKENEVSLFDVIGTNNCIIKIIKKSFNNIVIIQSYIDNLIKGASGQAVQNMNLMYGFNEYESLNLKKLKK